MAPQWGASYRDERLNEIARQWNEASCGWYLDAGLVKPMRYIRKKPKTPPVLPKKRKPPCIEGLHGFASPNRIDATSARRRGLEVQREKREHHWKQIEEVVASAIRQGYDTPQRLQRFLDSEGIRTVRGNKWSRQAAANLIRAFHASDE